MPLRIGILSQAYHPAVGGVTEHVLDALRIPHAKLESPDHVARRIQKAQTLAYSASRPVALLLCRDLMWEEAS